MTRERGRNARSAQPTDEDPPVGRSRRTTTRNATLVSKSTGKPQSQLKVAPTQTVESNLSVLHTPTAVTTKVSKQFAARQNQGTVQRGDKRGDKCGSLSNYR